MKNQEELLKPIADLFEYFRYLWFGLQTEFKNNDEWDSLTALSLITLLVKDYQQYHVFEN